MQRNQRYIIKFVNGAIVAFDTERYENVKTFDLMVTAEKSVASMNQRCNQKQGV